MKSVWKFLLPRPDDHVTLSMPIGSQPLHVANQQGESFLWALVDPGAPTDEFHFRWAGTGHPIEEPNAEYVGTWMMDDGMLVWHLFWLRARRI